jgi:hypothetical protein
VEDCVFGSPNAHVDNQVACEIEIKLALLLKEIRPTRRALALNKTLINFSELPGSSSHVEIDGKLYARAFLNQQKKLFVGEKVPTWNAVDRSSR